MPSFLSSLHLLLLFSFMVQPVLFVLALGGLVLGRRSWDSSFIPFSLFLSAMFYFVLSLLLWILGSLYPLFLILQLVLMGLGFLASKADKRLHWRSIPFALLIYFFAYNQFGSVEKNMEAEVLWEIPAGLGKPDIIQAHLVSHPGHYWEFTHDKLLSYLPQRQIPNALAEYTLVYEWGGVTKVQLRKMAGQNLAQERDNLNIFTCDGPCDLKSPFPRWYWGARGIQQRQPLTEYTLLNP